MLQQNRTDMTAESEGDLEQVAKSERPGTGGQAQGRTGWIRVPMIGGGGHLLMLEGQHRQCRLDGSGRTHQMPQAPFRAECGTGDVARLEGGRESAPLGSVVVTRSGSMQRNRIDLACGQTGPGEETADDLREDRSVGSAVEERRRIVEQGSSPPDSAGTGSAPSRMLGTLHHDDARPFSNQKAIAVPIERFAGAGRVVVGSRQDSQAAIGGEQVRGERGIAAASQDDVTLATFEQFGTPNQADQTGGTSGDRAE